MYVAVHVLQSMTDYRMGNPPLARALANGGALDIYILFFLLCTLVRFYSYNCRPLVKIRCPNFTLGDVKNKFNVKNL